MKPRRFGLYFAWSRPKELGQELSILDNRFPTIFEFRRILWPEFERLKELAGEDAGIKGFLDHVILSDFEEFRKVIMEATGNEVPVIQRVDNKPPSGQLDDNLLKEIDTLIVVSLDHRPTKQEATQGEIELIRAFLSKEENCLILCPHHDIGVNGQQKDQEIEFKHHGDPTIPPQQLFGGFAASVLKGLGLGVQNQFGLNPAMAGDGSPAPLEVNRDADRTWGLLKNVSTFNLHPHLPHLYVPPDDAAKVVVLARQAINLSAPPHPFVEAGNRLFNALLQSTPGLFPGKLVICDATMWSSAFGGLGSLRQFWVNLALLTKRDT